MNRKELAEVIADKNEISVNKAYQIVGSLIDVIGERLKKNDSVTLVGFGTFSVARREARMGRNPATGKSLKIKARNVPKFKPGAGLKAKVNK